MVRDTHAIKTYIFCSLQAFVKLEFMRSEKIISNWYEIQRNLFTLVVREHIFPNLNSDWLRQYRRQSHDLEIIHHVFCQCVSPSSKF